MKALALVLALTAGGCAHRVTNRQVATVAIGAGLIAIVITAMVLSSSCNDCDNNQPPP